MLRELLQAVRGLGRSPGFSATVVALIAVGTGVTTGLFTLLDAFLLRSLPVPEPEQLVYIQGRSAAGKELLPRASILERLRGEASLVSGAFGYLDPVHPAEANGRQRVVRMFLLAGDYYAAPGAQPLLGRLLTPEDRGAVAVISYDYWQRDFAGDPAVLGETVRVGRTLLTVVGVTPRRFRGMVVAFPEEISMPLEMTTQIDGTPREGLPQSPLYVVARLRPGVSVRQAAERIAYLWPQWVDETIPAGRTRDQWRQAVGLKPLLLPAGQGRSYLGEIITRPLVALFAMAGVVLLTLCASVAGLLLVRNLGRCRELAIRQALGASRWQVMRQLLIETFLLTALGSAAGWLIARWIAWFSLGLFPPAVSPISLDLDWSRGIVAFAMGSILATGLLCGLAPALWAASLDVSEALKAGGRSAAARLGFRKALLVVQVAGSLLFLVTAALFGQTFQRLAAVPLGYQPDGAFAVMLTGQPPYRNLTPAYFDELVRRTRSLPGVLAAGLTNRAPLDSRGQRWTVENAATRIEAECVCAFPGFFQAAGIPLIEGRDLPDAASVAVVNRALAGRLFPAHRAIGQRFRHEKKDWEIIGLLADPKVSVTSLRDTNVPLLYVPCLELWGSPPSSYAMTLVVRTDTMGQQPPEGLVAAARREIDLLGKQFPYRITTLRELVDASLRQQRMLAVTSGVFSLLTLIVAGAGLCGLLMFIVLQRTREIGIRIALGAQRRQVILLVISQALAVLVGGLLLGLAGVFATSRLIAGFLYGVRPLDPPLLIVCVALLVSFSVTAAAVPASRAASIQPADALRAE
jgi:predicted permease